MSVAYTSVRDVRDAVSGVAAAVAASVATASALYTTDSATDQTAGALISAITTQQATIRAIRGGLDLTDVEGLQTYDDAAVTLALWTWERAVRRSLTRLESQLAGALAVAVELRSGRALTVYTTRPGDTLQSVAARFLGGWQEWTRIAAANGLAPSPVAAGTPLVIPRAV